MTLTVSCCLKSDFRSKCAKIIFDLKMFSLDIENKIKT